MQQVSDKIWLLFWKDYFGFYVGSGLFWVRLEACWEAPEAVQVSNKEGAD